MTKGIKKTCSKCGKLLEESRVDKQRYCKACHAENMRHNRPKHSELSPEARKKANARSYSRVYVERGVIEQKACEVCGKKAERHHVDYDKPLELVFLCREHHLELHKQEKLKHHAISNS